MAKKPMTNSAEERVEWLSWVRQLTDRERSLIDAQIKATAQQAREEALRPFWDVYNDYDYALVGGNTAKEAIPWEGVNEMMRDLQKALMEATDEPR